MLKEMIAMVYDAAIRSPFDNHIGAALHERSEERRDQRNGSRTRGLNTRAGSINLEIPRARNSNFLPTVIEQFRRSERALISVIQEAFVAGISTRKMQDVLTTMGVERLAKSQISELCTELDAKANDFRNRPLTDEYPYLWLDALYEKVHIGDSVVSNAVVIAYGVTVSGIRDVLAIDVVDTESKRAGRGFSKGCDDALVTGSSARSSLSAMHTKGSKRRSQSSSKVRAGNAARSISFAIFSLMCRKRASSTSRRASATSSHKFPTRQRNGRQRNFVSDLGRRS